MLNKDSFIEFMHMAASQGCCANKKGVGTHP